MTAREYLEQVQVIDKQINQKLKKAQMLRQSLYGRGINYEQSGVHTNSAGSGIEAVLVKIADYESEADTLIDELVTKRLEIEKAIATVPDEKGRTVLEHRYLYLQSWEEISVEMGYSKPHLYRLHREALQKIKYDSK
ncbi:MAG: DUF1492 domain-containing protein [Ruminococcus sp.]|nr:DUF1492 domain-containing protein [Ruminococcus sp.]